MTTPPLPQPHNDLVARLHRARMLLGDIPDADQAALRERAIQGITDFMLLTSMVADDHRNVSSMARATVEAFEAAADLAHREMSYRHEAPGYAEEAGHLIAELLAEGDLRAYRNGEPTRAINVLGEAAGTYQVCRPREEIRHHPDRSRLIPVVELIKSQLIAIYDDLNPHDAFMVLSHALAEGFGMYGSRDGSGQSS
ncbi:hypothetical protein GCM10022226_61630 [Sphaerisporangium flaviroseum]|uniref:Uncharacterized protein n=1 Tax=Sphaerisporangium flaviroseum TaxID=509199 RepID=A0ABP7J196_9ACTN